MKKDKTPIRTIDGIKFKIGYYFELEDKKPGVLCFNCGPMDGPYFSDEADIYPELTILFKKAKLSVQVVEPSYYELILIDTYIKTVGTLRKLFEAQGYAEIAFQPEWKELQKR